MGELTIGSLFSGYGGLDMGVQAALGGRVAWHCEIEPAPSRILAHHWPDVPNLGDITKVDWATVEPVDIITGGSPCQDVSHAGKRAGMRVGTRSGLWASMTDAIDIIRPGLVVWENVRGVLSAGADSGVEPCPICVGDERAPDLRALGRVVGDLAELGYDARWTGLRASDVGAPHGRFRVFVVATDAQERGGRAGQLHVATERGEGDSQPRWGTAAHADRSAGDQRWIAASGQAEGGRARSDAGRRDRALATDAGGQRHGSGQDGRSLGPLDGDDAGEARQRERAREVAGNRSDATAADTAQPERRGAQPDLLGTSTGSAAEPRERAGAVARARDGRPDLGEDGRVSGGLVRPGGSADGLPGPTAWGQYEPAIRRWERTLGRLATPPTEPGSKGQPRLSPAFVEWLMGLPAGHVTGVPGISRNDQLKALGNGVVPQQAAAAVAHALEVLGHG